MTDEDFKELFASAKDEVHSWGVVTNKNNTDEQVREGVLEELLKKVRISFGRDPDDPIQFNENRSRSENLKDAIVFNVFRPPDLFHPGREIEEVVRTALKSRKR